MKTPTTITALLLMIAGCATPNLATQQANKPAIDAAQLELNTIHSTHNPRAFESFEEAAYRTAELGYKVQTTGVDICGPEDRKPTSGFLYHTEYKNGPVIVSEVFPGSPADKAGLIKGDQIVQIGHTGITGKKSLKKFQRAMGKALKATSQNGEPISLSVKRNWETENLTIHPTEACKYPVVLVADSDLNAYADGKNIVIFKGIYDLTENDSQLLVVIGHEMAHNSGKHVSKKKTNRAVAGLFGFILDMGLAYANAQAGQQHSGDATFTKAGLALGSLAWSKSFEREADYAGLYFAHLAGADINEGLRFWKLMHRAKDENGHAPEIAFQFTGTHPSDAERYANLKATIAEILAKVEANQALQPNKKKDTRKRRQKTRGDSRR